MTAAAQGAAWSQPLPVEAHCSNTRTMRRRLPGTTTRTRSRSCSPPSCRRRQMWTPRDMVWPESLRQPVQRDRLLTKRIPLLACRHLLRSWRPCSHMGTQDTPAEPAQCSQPHPHLTSCCCGHRTIQQPAGCTVWAARSTSRQARQAMLRACAPQGTACSFVLHPCSRAKHLARNVSSAGQPCVLVLRRYVSPFMHAGRGGGCSLPRAGVLARHEGRIWRAADQGQEGDRLL